MLKRRSMFRLVFGTQVVFVFSAMIGFMFLLSEVLELELIYLTADPLRLPACRLWPVVSRV